MNQDVEEAARRGRGAPKGNHNALKHSRHVKAMRDLAALRGKIRARARATIAMAGVTLAGRRRVRPSAPGDAE